MGLRNRWLTVALALAVGLGAASGGPLSPPVKTVSAASSTPAPKSAQPTLKVGEQPQMRTRYSTTTFNADHTFTTRISGHPVNYSDKLGHWQPIDSTLTASKALGYAYQNRANSFQTLCGTATWSWPTAAALALAEMVAVALVTRQTLSKRSLYPPARGCRGHERSPHLGGPVELSSSSFFSGSRTMRLGQECRWDDIRRDRRSPGPMAR